MPEAPCTEIAHDGRTTGAAAAVVFLGLFVGADRALRGNRRRSTSAAPKAAPQASPQCPSDPGSHRAQQARGRRHSRPRSASATNENMGRIVDVLVDPNGQVRAAIIDFGGFLGVGSRKIAVEWGALHFPPPGKPGARDHARTHARPGESRAAIPGRQACRRPRRTRQTRTAYPNSTDAGASPALWRPALRLLEQDMASEPAAPSKRSAGAARRHPPQQSRPGNSLSGASRRCGRHSAACAGSIGSSSLSPTCRPASGRSFRSILPRRNGRRSTSASCCPPAGFVSLIGQMPGGALVDAARSERLVAGDRHRGDLHQRLGYAVLPIFPMVLSASILHALASCVLGPAIAAISLGLVGHAAIGSRFGRNARFASVGNGLAAAAMGACGYLISARAVFRRHRVAARPGARRVAHDITGRDRSGTRA